MTQPQQNPHQRRSVSIFAVISGGAITIALLLAWHLVSQTTQETVLTSTEAANQATTEIFASEVWHEIAPLLPAHDANTEQIRANPNLLAIDNRVRLFSRNTDIVKVKILVLHRFHCEFSFTPAESTFSNCLPMP